MDLGRFGQLAPRGVGRDGMAFAAVDPEQTGKRVELRVLVTAPGSRTARRRAEQRLRAAAMLRHPAAASVTELLLEHDPPFAVLPFVDGERLDLRLAHRPADLFTTWAWSEQIAGALVEAHRLGLAHGRLTPSSAVVLKSGELVVDLLGLDFGLVPAEGAAREAARFDRSALAPERTGSPYTEMSISSQSSGASALPRGAGSSAGSGSPGGAVSLRELKRRAAALAISEDDQEGSGRAEATVRAETLVADQAADVFSLAAWWFAFWFREPLSVSVWHRLTTGRPVDALPEFPTDLAANGPPAEPFAELLADMLAVEPVERPTAREAMLRFEALRGNGRKTPGPTKQTQSAALGATFDTIGLGSTRDAQWPAGDDEVSSVAATVSPADPRAIAEANTRFDLSGLPAASPARPNESISALSLAAADREQVTTRRRLTPGEMLGRFEIIAKLGEGGMGAVYKARDPLADREVAIKLLAPHLARSEGARRRFTKEARVLATVNNPYIANLYEFNQDGDAHYLVLEYVPGRSVEKLLDERGALAEETAVSIAADVARALVDAHRRGIVHRDVKPENILIVEETARENTFAAEIVRPSLAPSLQAKLTDFGIAGVSDPSESMAITQAGAMLGTPLYMAPEQWQKSSAVDASSDVYALGGTLFHLLTGKPPYGATDAVGLMKQHCLEEVPSPRAVNPALSEVVDEIVKRALAKSPAERFPDAESLLEALERHRRGEPTTVEMHPRLPDDDARNVFDVTFAWDLESPAEKLWPLLANTDRLNQAIGLPAPEWEVIDKGETSERYGAMTIMFMRLRWREHPFEWIENRRLSVLREFETGPFAWFVSTVDLLPRPEGGTTVKHRLRVRPRGLFGRLAAMIEMGVNTRRKMDRMHKRLDEWARTPVRQSSDWSDAFTPSVALPMLSVNRIQTRMVNLRQRGVDAETASALERYLLTAPDQAVSRMRPWALADELKVDRNAMLTTLLQASREGLVKMMWDVLCPVCRIPSESHDSLTLLRDHGRCDVCKLDFDLDFAEAVELFFRGHPDVRDAEPKTYCIGAPTFSPHVVAQIRLAPQERFELTLRLPPGDYVLRGPQWPYQVGFVVDKRSAVTRWDHAIGRRPSLTEELRFSPERQTLVLTNSQSHEVTARVERTIARSDAVTAAFASAFGPFREIMPREILADGRAGAVPSVTILFAAIHQADAIYAELGDAGAFDALHRAFQLMDREIQRREGALVKTIGGGALAVFPQMEAALECAAAIDRALPTLPGPRLALQACVHRGPAMLTTINQRLDYFGAAVNIVSTLVRAAGPGEAILTAPVFSDPGVRQTLAALAGPGASTGKGFLRAKLPNGSYVLVQRIKLGEPSGASIAAGSRRPAVPR